MKKYFTLLCILYAMMLNSGQAANAPITTISQVNSNLASTTVAIKATNFVNIGSCGLRISYNSAIVTPTGVTTGNPLLGSFVYYGIPTAGTLNISWFGTPAVTVPDNSTIFNITFSKVTGGTSQLTFVDDGNSCFWADDNDVTLNDTPTSTYYINGSITLGNAPVTKAPVITACPGTDISIPITVSNFDNIGQVFALRMLYTSAVLTYRGYTNSSGFTGLTVNGATAGQITVTSSQSTSSSGISYPANTVLFTLNFTYNGGTSGLTWDDTGVTCLYRGPSATFTFLNDVPTASFYINGTVEPLVAPVITKNPNTTSVCQSPPVSATFSAGSGSSNGVDHYESSVDGATTWQTYVPGDPLSALSSGSAKIQVRAWRTSTGTACVNSGYNTASWDVVALSQGGTLTGAATVCAGTNSTLLSVSGYNGTITKWQSSTDGTNWSDIANTNSSYTATNLSATTSYRVVVKNGICDAVNSNAVTVTVKQIVPVGISIAANSSTVCAG